MDTHQHCLITCLIRIHPLPAFCFTPHCFHYLYGVTGRCHRKISQGAQRVLYNDNLRVGDSAEVMTHGVFYEEEHQVLRKFLAQKHLQIFNG